MENRRPNFQEVYKQYLGEMGLTFPELEKSTDKALKKSISDFSKSVAPILHDIANRNSSVFTDQGVQIAPGVIMTKKLWATAGKPTHKAIWEFLSSLILLASYEQKTNTETDDFTNIFDISGAESDLKKMFGDLGEQFSKESFSSFFDGLKGAADSFKEQFAGVFSGISGEVPPIPERLFKGHIAKIAEEIAREFNPEDFGIAPEILSSNDPTAVFEYLQTIFTQKPEMLMKGAKKIANRIQEKLKRGDVKREDLIREAEELMAEFQNNTMFKEIFESLGSMLKTADTESNNAPSERRRVVQERLRKKMAAKKGDTGKKKEES